MPEVQLILLLAPVNLNGAQRAKAAALLAKPLNWNLILERVTAEEVYPLFFRNLERASGVKRDPTNTGRDNAMNAKDAEHDNATNAINAIAALDRLRHLTKINAFRSTVMTEELARLLKLLAAAEIPAIPLKGPALAQMLYGDPALRSSVDLDILVPRSMVRRAFDLLRADGYESEFGPGFFADLLLRHSIEYSLRRHARGFDFVVELHWGILWGGKGEENIAQQLWADSYPATVFGAPAHALTKEWHILVLAAHAARHQWQGLKWLVDLHELCSSPNVDWDELHARARQLGWNELLRICLIACHSLFDTPAPGRFLVGELPPWVKLFPNNAQPHLNNAFFATRLISKPLGKLRYAARVLLIPTLAELRFLTLPSLLALLYYPLRPLRLTCKWSWGFLAGAMRAKKLSSVLGIGFEILDWDWLLDLAQ